MALLQSTDQSDSDFEQSVSGVEIDVQVRKIESRKRQIEAKIELPYPIENVWNVLTDYEALSEFIPNLELSHCIERPDGGIRVEQIGSQCALMLKFSARVVLDMEEHYPKVLSFDMVEGDFNGFNGQWKLAPCREGSGNTELTYSVKVWPKITMPIVAVEQRLAKDLPINLQAIRRRLDALYGSREICAA